jgi:hypothetical protein
MAQFCDSNTDHAGRAESRRAGCGDEIRDRFLKHREDSALPGGFMNCARQREKLFHTVAPQLEMEKAFVR